MVLTNSQQEVLTGSLALEGAATSLPKFLERIKKAMASKNLSLAKMLRIYSVIKKAVEDVEAIVKEK